MIKQDPPNSQDHTPEIATPQPARRGWFGLWPWLIVTGLLSVLTAALWLHLDARDPERVEIIAATPPRALPDADLVARAAQLRALIALREAELGAAIETLDPPRCVAPESADPLLLELAQDREAPNIARWRALLGAPAPAPMSRRKAAVAPRPGGTAPALDTPALRARLEASSAIVLGMGTANAQTLVNGSAFFISATLLITNRHVVEGIRPDTLLVTGSAFDRVRRAEIVAMSPDGGPGGPDFALLRLLAGAAPGVARITIAADKLTPVIAAGYPGMSLMNDRGFKDLMAGDAGAAPDLNMNRGEIRSIRKLGRITRIIHTADVLPGYSGGPLMDLCGRVAGVNTFIQVDQAKGAKLNNALSGADLAAFLQSAGVEPRIDDRVCAAQ